MYVKSATEARKEWSQTCDSAVREKPGFIKRTRDLLVLSSAAMLSDLLEGYRYTADEFIEDDGSVTLALNEMDLAENATTKEDALHLLGSSILDYAEEYYNAYDVYSKAPNRRSHAPYILKALLIADPIQIGKEIICQIGKS